MFNHPKFLFRFSRLTLFVVGLALLTVTAWAQTPNASLVLLVTPSEQLTSIPGDERRVDFQLNVTGNVQFWAVSVTCRLGTGSQVRPPDGSTNIGDIGQANYFIRFGPDWGVYGDDYTAYATYDAGQGIFDVVVSRVGADQTPLGINGITTTTRLLTANFRVNDLSSTQQVNALCTNADLLDRNGNVVFSARPVAQESFVAYTGYTISGQTLRPGATYAGEVYVRCVNTQSLNAYDTVSNSQGIFAITNIREQGRFDCTFQSYIANTLDTQFLTSTISLNLNTASYKLLPVLVRPGDYQDNGVIDFSDLSIVTANLGQSVGTGFVNGDANGNRLVGDPDVALVAGNVGLVEPVASTHLVYGLGRDYDTSFDFPNSKLWYGTQGSGAVRSLATFPYPAFWPRVSPNGEQVVFTGDDVRVGQYYLFIAPVNGSATFLTASSFAWDSFAPSWSPGGTRIAFVCSEPGTDFGYEFNEGFLCLMSADAAQSSSASVVLVNGLRLESKIFPPAWYDENVIIYAGLPDNPDCPNTLCFYDMASNVVGEVRGAEVLAQGGDVADMPYIQNVGGVTYLTYRFYDSTAQEHKIGVVQLSYDPDNFTFSGGIDLPPGAATHVYVPGSELVDYYTVSPDLDILMYPFSALNFYELLNTGGLNWTAGDTFYVDGAVGNPTWQSGPGGGPGIPWDGSLNTPTMLHAERMTFQWIP